MPVDCLGTIAASGSCCHLKRGAKRADKPGPVQMLPSVTIIPLGAPLLMRSSNLPVDSASRFNAYCLVLLRMGFTLPDTVTSAAVRSYRPLNGAPLTRTPFHPYLQVDPNRFNRLFNSAQWRFSSLLHFPSAHAAWSLTSILLYGARTFLPRQHYTGSSDGLSRFAVAIITAMGGWGKRRYLSCRG